MNLILLIPLFTEISDGIPCRLLPVGVSVADCVVSRVLLLISCHVETHLLPIPLTLLPLALSRNVAFEGPYLRRWRMGGGGYEAGNNR